MYILGPVHLGSQALTRVSKSQHGGKVPAFGRQDTIQNMVDYH